MVGEGRNGHEHGIVRDTCGGAVAPSSSSSDGRFSYSCELTSLADFAAGFAAQRTFVAGAVTAADAKADADMSSPPSPQFDFILSNPPYIPSADVLALAPEVQRFESSAALDGGEDGLAMVRELLRLAPELLRRPVLACAGGDASGGDGCDADAEGARVVDVKADRGGELWMEVDHRHPPQLERWFAEQDGEGGRWIPDGTGARVMSERVRGLRLIACQDDLSGNPRFVGVGMGKVQPD